MSVLFRKLTNTKQTILFWAFPMGGVSGTSLVDFGRFISPYSSFSQIWRWIELLCYYQEWELETYANVDGGRLGVSHAQRECKWSPSDKDWDGSCHRLRGLRWSFKSTSTPVDLLDTNLRVVIFMLSEALLRPRDHRLTIPSMYTFWLSQPSCL